MRRVALLAVAALAVTAVASGQSANKSLKFSVKLVQEQTLRHHVTTAQANDTFSTTLKLFNDTAEPNFGVSPNGRVGTMEFNWGPLRGRCSNHSAGCQGTTDINTVTRLPGGTITAGGTDIPLSKGIVVRIQGGTGIFKGARGTIEIAPAWAPKEIFDVKLPA